MKKWIKKWFGCKTLKEAPKGSFADSLKIVKEQAIFEKIYQDIKAIPFIVDKVKEFALEKSKKYKEDGYEIVFYNTDDFNSFYVYTGYMGAKPDNLSDISHFNITKNNIQMIVKELEDLGFVVEVGRKKFRISW